MITSSKNPKLQWVRSLLNKSSARREEGVFVVEGVRLVEEALTAAWPARLVLYTEEVAERGQQVVQGFLQRQAPVEEVSPAALKAVAGTENPQGLLAVMEIRSLPMPENSDFILILDEIRDPGNLGTILRTADAAGVQGVLLPPGNADPYAPKVVRAGMGAHFRLPLERLDWDALPDYLQEKAPGLTVYLAEASGELAYTQVDFRAPLALLIGGEAEGASSEGRALAGERVRIPMPGGAESLNAAVAAGVLMFEVVRQRGR